MIIQYTRIRETARPPVRANPSDAGLDLFYNPPNRSAVVKIQPGESKLFQTGYKFGVPHGYMLEIKNRSSVAAKQQLIVGACVVDSGYAGEVFVNLQNIGTDEVLVSPGDKIAQAVLLPVIPFRPQEVSEENLYSSPITISNRGDGALGSTDRRE
tara:strand:+ start:27 stop:491 length:465 start_codon:yes stop_codon:yes gene_type:complete